MSDVWREGLRKVGGRFQREGGGRKGGEENDSSERRLKVNYSPLRPPRASLKLHPDEDMLGESLLHLPEGGGGGGEGEKGGREGSCGEPCCPE